jgi:hypothetical protein
VSERVLLYREDYVQELQAEVVRLRAALAQAEARATRYREALELMRQAFDPTHPAACHQECFDTSDGHGYEVQDAALDAARAALATAPRDPPAVSS